MEYTLDQDGNAIAVKGEAAKPKKGKAAKEDRESEYSKARRALVEWGKPIAFAAGVAWSFDTATGWVDASDAFLNHCNRIAGRNAVGGVYAVACALSAIPSDHHCYHKLVDGVWVPYEVGQSEVVFTDYRYDLLRETSEPHSAPVFGPMIGVELAVDGPAPRCEEFEATVAGALPDPEIRRHFQEVMGAILQPHVPFRHQIVLWGAKHAWKSTIATAIATAPGGVDGASHVPEDALVRDKWSSAALYNRFCNVSDDSDVNKRWGPWLKRYTSGSMVVEAKFHQPKTVPTTAKLISTCNELTPLIDASGAAMERLIPFRFSTSQLRTEQVGRDGPLSPRYWAEPRRRAGVVTWLLEGLERLYARGAYDPPLEWERQRAVAAEEADPVESDIRELVCIRPGGFIPSSALIAALPTLAAQGRRGETILGQYVIRMFSTARRVRRSDPVLGRVRGWEGVDWTTCPTS